MSNQEIKTDSDKWIQAIEHLNSMLERYEGLLGMPQCNPMFMLAILHRLKQRVLQGERTDDLFDEIMSLID